MIAVLAFIQFTVILDFMVLSPLSAFLLKEMKIGPDQFSLVVSAYAFSAGASGLLAAGFADKFDRKRLLLFFYAGFVIGTALCALSPTYEFLLLARIFTGIFGGVIGSIAFAIITDIFKLEVRGRVMGFVQMAFAVSQVIGLPVGLYLANAFDWHAPFWLIVGFSVPAGVVIMVYMRPVNAHLQLKTKENPFLHLFHTLTKSDYLKGFAATALLATGGYMLMPLGAAYSTENLGLTKEELPILYLVTGLFTIFFGPLSGKLADRFGKYKVFVVGCLIAMAMVAWYTNLGITPLWVLILINVILFAGLTARMIAASALVTAIPDPADRGAYMGVNSSIQQISGGISAYVAGLIVVQPQLKYVENGVAMTKSGPLEHYPALGMVVIGSLIATIILFWGVDRMVTKKHAAAPSIVAEKVPVAIAE
ncbi:MAG TPA: MFS transporter [Bacteroidia bacterium]|nr:MFS transporter [Bacteroidia bacterium]